MDDAPTQLQPPGRRSGSIRGLVIFAVASFVVGTLVMTWAVARWAPLQNWLIAYETSDDASLPKPVSAPASGTEQPRADLTPADIDALEARFDKINARAGTALQDASRAEGLLIIIATRRAVDRGLPLGYLEAALQQHFGAEKPKAVGQLLANARPPVSLDQLQNDLDGIAPELLSSGAKGDWFSSLAQGVDGLATLRRADQPSQMPASKLDRARRALSHDRVDLAIKEVAGLPGANKAKAWQAKARRYLNAHAALDELEAASLAIGPVAGGLVAGGPVADR